MTWGLLVLVALPVIALLVLVAMLWMGSGPPSDDGVVRLYPARRIITMEWVGEGLTLCFIGALGALIVLADGLSVSVGRLVLRGAAAMLFVMAGLTAATGARTPIGPIKACPIVKSVVAAMYVAAAGM